VVLNAWSQMKFLRIPVEYKNTLSSYHFWDDMQIVTHYFISVTCLHLTSEIDIQKKILHDTRETEVMWLRESFRSLEQSLKEQEDQPLTALTLYTLFV
jgi:hypothetical protein